ncbi:hypothetical protein D9611_001413 [Ephemerocybe angulata]|uniref:Uncharacterized protein n=1 Tax=Ephemerocybe angulata TaxID=980116 RepID=A0A8H5CIU0_9AGAR|nr:hypothetical protein D9611_001413 [Tulosesus angulatus]
MATPPLPEHIDGGSMKGSQSAKAFFHDPFTPLSPMGVFEIFSNACSPPTQEMQSPTSSDGSDAQYTPIFDTLNSPTEAFTAPSTPTSDFIHEDAGGDERKAAQAVQAMGSDDDLALSALMIRGVPRFSSKRNGVSGELLSKRKDVPLWVPDTAECNIGSTGPPAKDDSATVEEQTETERAPDAEVTQSPGPAISTAPDVTDSVSGAHPVHSQLKPNNPLSWCDGWLTSEASPTADDESVYSMDSFVPSVSTPVQDRQSAPAVPRITLTPASLPTSPDIASPLDLADGDLFKPAARDEEPHMADNSNIFSATALLVPGCRSFERDSEDEADEAAIKRRRRNACRLNTSSIDIIMAGLDQEFPDTPIASPMLSPSDLAQDIIDIKFIDDSDVSAVTEDDGFLSSPGLGPSYAPSSPATTARNSLADLSGETLMIEDEPESKFSDSSDEEGDIELPKLAGSMALKHTGLSWPVCQVPFGPSSGLSTIEEEDEDGSRDPVCKIKDGLVANVLGPSAVITATAMVCHPPTPRLKKRWFSMIEAKGSHSDSVQSIHKKRMSAPASILSSSRSRRSLSTAAIERPRPARARNFGAVDRPKSLVRPLILPQQVAIRSMAVGDGVNADSALGSSSSGVSSSLSDFEFNMPSSRSSSCISLYQRPWSLYVPVEEHHRDYTTTEESSTSVPTSTSAATQDSLTTLVDTNPLVVEDSSADIVDLDEDETTLVMNSPSSEGQGLNGILAILDSMDLGEGEAQSVMTSATSSPTSLPPSPDADAINAILEAMGSTELECNIGTSRPWSNGEFISYYDGSDEGPCESGFAI